MPVVERDFIWLPCAMSIEQLIEAACRLARCTEADLMGPSRERRINYPRQELMLILHERGWSLSEIGRRFDRHHTVVMDGVQRARARGDAWKRCAPWFVEPEIAPPTRGQSAASPAPMKARPAAPRPIPATDPRDAPHVAFLAAVNRAHPHLFKQGI
jgi:hypothetical protein